MTSEIDDVAVTLKSCLMTFKNGTILAELNKNYEVLEGRSIPFRKLGYQTLESFVQSVPGVRTLRRGRDLWIETIPTKETAHISKLVAGQNQSKSRRRSHLHQASRRYQGMSRNSVRAVNSINRAPTRVSNTANYNTRNNISARPQTRASAPKPLMQMPIGPPLTVSTGQHRYMGTAGSQMSPSKRMIQRAIQPMQDQDYARNRPVTMGGRVAPNPTISEVPQISNNQRSVDTTNPLTSGPHADVKLSSNFLAESSLRTNPPIIRPLIIEPLISRPTGITWQPPPSRPRLCDRLAINSTLPTFNSSITNGNGNIQVTFLNVRSDNDAVIDNAVSAQEKPKLEHDPREELRDIARELDRGAPVYKIVPVPGKNSSKIYGKVEIGSAKFSSYPQEAETKSEAEILAAVQALVELRKEHPSALRSSPTSDKQLIKKRLLAIVDEHNGIFTHKIPLFYQEKFNETLPKDWTKEINQWNEVVLDSGVDESIILRRAEPSTPDKAPALPVIEKGFLKPICHVEPGHLELPEEHSWVAYVALVTSTAEIWVRLVGENYSDKFEAMTSEMIEHYSAISTRGDGIEAGGYYAIMENDVWHRVRVLECDLTCNEAEVFFIDLGDEDTVEMSRLYPLERKFCSLPCQAIRVSLMGLEDFADCDSVLPRIEEILLEGVFYIMDFSREIDEVGPIASVIIYDTSSPDDVDVNELLTNKILQSVTPRLEGEGRVPAVHVSHVETNGDVFIQVKHDGLRALVRMLNKLTETGLSAEDRKKSALNRVDRSTVYFVRCAESGDWFRARFLDIAPETKDGTRRLKMFLVDFGRALIVDLSNVIQLETLSELLAKFPAQAIKVRLDNIDSKMFNVEMFERLKELAPPSQLLLLKIVKPSSSDSPPFVELFKRIQPNNVLVCINKALAAEYEFTEYVDGDGNNNVKSSRRRFDNYRSDSRATIDLEETAKALPAPKIGEIGEYFDVHVTMAANPGNFTVQPFETMEELRSMMRKLQKVCGNSSNGSHPTLESIKEGHLYAARHSDGDWYRGCVLNVINEQMLMVYFVDYGDVTSVGLEKLRPLARQFLDLPYQAIKARLVDIKPRNNDWSPEDCVRFQELIVERNLVSIVAKIDADRHLPRDTVLGLTLIDVSTADDVYIGEVLVQEGRAVHNV